MIKNGRVYAEIDLDAIAYNFQKMRENINPATNMIAVVKTDGYGHGAVPIAELAEDYPYIWGFAVATAEEALELKEAGIKKPVLILGYTFEEHYEIMVEQEIRPVVFKWDMAEIMSRAAEKLGKTFAVHLAVDTGMGRIGFPRTGESIEVIRRIAALPNLYIEGLFTHFSKADEKDKAFAEEQIRRFEEFTSMLEDAGISIPIKHCSNSAGILEIPKANMNAVRAGITIYGIYPSEEVEQDSVPLRPAMSWKSHIVYIKEVEAGTPVSYGGTYITTDKARIATIPVGYGDGYPRALSNRGWVLIRGKRAPILGRVCMDQFMVDVTEIPEARELDEVVLMGESESESLPVEMLSELSGRFPYEFVCNVGRRVPRIYRKNGKI